MKEIREAPADNGGQNKLPTTRSAYMLTANRQECTEVMVLFRILTRRSWDELQAWHRACPGSTVEHLYRGLYVLTIPAGGAEVTA